MTVIRLCTVSQKQDTSNYKLDYNLPNVDQFSSLSPSNKYVTNRSSRHTSNASLRYLVIRTSENCDNLKQISGLTMSCNLIYCSICVRVNIQNVILWLKYRHGDVCATGLRHSQ